MPIYIDQLVAYRQAPKPGGERYFGNGKQSCHMATNESLDRLHDFALALGLKREWFQEHRSVPHYDLRPSRRRTAVRMGAIEVPSTKELIKICKQQSLPDIRIIICGGRDWDDDELIHQEIERLRGKYGERLVIVHGDWHAGADRIAKDYCERMGYRHDPQRAEWTVYGKSAGPLRNRRMAELGAHGCVAFNTGGNGTDSMITEAKKKNIPVIGFLPDRSRHLY